MEVRGRTVAITRAARDAREFVRLAREAGAEPLPLPTIELRARAGIAGEFMRAAQEYDPDYTVFMSSRAVSLLFDAAESESLHDRLRMAVANTSVVAVGPVTRAALKERGIRAAHMPGTYSSVGIGELFSRIGGGRVLVPRSGASTPFLRELLEKIGVSVRELVLYDVRACPDSPEWASFRAMLPNGGIDGIIFTSASSVRAFFEIMGRSGGSAGTGRASVVSIGPFTSAELDRFGVSHTVAEVHTVPGALDAMRRAL